MSEEVCLGSGLVSALPEEWPGGDCSAVLVLQDQAAEAALAVRLATPIHRAVPDASIGIIARAAVRSTRTADPKRAVGPGVHLLNAQTVRGQQFDWAIVVGLEEGHLPGKWNSHGDVLNEEQRVLLVMLFRARHGLVVTRGCENDGWYGPKPVAASRWWSKIKTRYSAEEGVQARIEEFLSSQETGPDDRHDQRGFAVSPGLSASRYARYRYRYQKGVVCMGSIIVRGLDELPVPTSDDAACAARNVKDFAQIDWELIDPWAEANA